MHVVCATYICLHEWKARKPLPSLVRRLDTTGSSFM
nr:MAG TPA: hypothetical protein [Inoviridae sp.]